MVDVVAGTNIALRLSALDIANLIDGTFTTQTSTTAVVDIGDGYIETFTGTGFTYSGGTPNGGTINSISEKLNGVTTFSVTGLNQSVTQFVQWAQTGANILAFSTMLAGNDNLTGNTLNDYLEGFAGHDNLFGGAGADTLGGGFGNDHLYGQSANGGQDGADSIYGDEGSDYLQGNAGNDMLDGGDGSDRINGGANDDLIFGKAGNDTANGNLGNDTIDGGSGNDSLRGGQGNDSVAGDAGNDILSGDLGSDMLMGGSGADIFVFSGQGSLTNAADRITDYVDGTDRIAVGYAPANVLTAASQSSLSAAATAAQALFDGNAGNGEVAAITVGSDSYIFYSSNGGATADSAILVVGVTSGSLGLSDFTTV